MTHLDTIIKKKCHRKKNWMVYYQKGCKHHDPEITGMPTYAEVEFPIRKIISKDTIIKQFREKFAHEFEGATHSTEEDEKMQNRFEAFLRDALSSYGEEVRKETLECPRHHEQLRCRSCLAELEAIEGCDCEFLNSPTHKYKCLKP